MIPQPIDQVPLFLNLSEDERELLCSRLRHLQFNTNDPIFTAHRPPELLGVITQGWVKVERESSEGRVALDNLGAGSLVGEVDLLLNRPYSTSARAASMTNLLALYRQDLHDLILECPTIGLKFSSSLGSRVAYLDQYLVTQRLATLPMLSAAAEDELAALATRMQFQSFERGETIFHSSDAGDALFLIESGAARLITPSREGESFEELKEGDIFGQTALITGKPFSSTALAVTDLNVWVLHHADYQELIRDYPSLKLAFSRALAEGLGLDDQAQALEQLRGLPIFYDVDLLALRDIAAHLVLRHFPAGELIYAEGTPGDAMYFVEAGEVRLVSDAATEAEFLDRKGANQSFGEMALLTGRTRAEAAKAISDTTVWVLYKSDYDDLIVLHPALSLALSRALRSRLGDSEGEFVERHLHQLKLFAGLSQSELKEVAEFVKPLRFRANEVVCYAGQPAQFIYMIESGEVREIAGGTNGQSVVLELLSAHQSFGEQAVVQSSTYPVTVQAVGDVECWTLAKPDFDRLLTRYPALAISVTRRMAEELERATKRLSRLTTNPTLASNKPLRAPAPPTPPRPPVRPTPAIAEIHRQAAAARPQANATRPVPAPRPQVVAARPQPVVQAAAVRQPTQTVGVRAAPAKPWEQASSSVMRPMPAATARPVRTARPTSVAPSNAASQLARTTPASGFGLQVGGISTGAKIKLGILALFALFVVVIIPIVILLLLLTNFGGILTSVSAGSNDLPADLNNPGTKQLGMLPIKFAVHERTATPTALAAAAAPVAQATARPTRRPTRAAVVKPKAVTARTTPDVTSGATPTEVAAAAAIHVPPLGPIEWDSRLGGSGSDPLLSGIALIKTSVPSGQTFWRLVKMKFEAAGAESGNDHTIYISIVDENGNRLDDQVPKVTWDESGVEEDGQLTLDDQKARGDYCNCNYNWPMYGAGYRVKIEGMLASDLVVGMIMPMKRHVNYRLTFQRTVMP